LRTRFAAIEVADHDAAFVQYISRQRNTIRVMRDRELGKIVGEVIAGPICGAEAKVGVRCQSELRIFPVLSMSHSLYDAWALHLLHQQVARIYESPNLEERDTTTIPYEKAP